MKGTGESLIAGVLLSGLRHVILEIQRRRQVCDAIEDANDIFPTSYTTPIDSVIKKAYHDVGQAFGRLGKLDSDLDTFLNALENSNLLKPLALAAYTGRDWKRLQYGVYQIYIGSLGRDGSEQDFKDCSAVTREIVSGIKAHLSHPDVNRQLILLSDTVNNLHRDLLNFISIQEKKWSIVDRNNRYILSSDEIRNVKPWIFVNPAHLSNLVKELSRSSCEEYGKITVSKPDRQSAALSFHDIYVQNRISISSKTAPFSPDVDLIGNALDFASKFPAAVVLGNPGGGKSTLAQGYCLSLAEIGKDNGIFLPVFVRIRELFSEIRKDPNLSIIEYVIKDICRISESFQYDELLNPLRNLFYNGRGIFIFDGLDEVLSVDERISTIKQVNQFMVQWSNCSFLFTSRSQGYAEAPLPNYFTKIQLLPFNEDESRKFFQLIGKIVFDKNEKDLNNSTDRFMFEAKRNAPDLIEVPLLLSLIIWLFHSIDRIPDNRLDVYDQCSKLLFVDWDPKRKIISEVLEYHRLLQLLPVLAGHIYPDQNLVSGVSRKWLKQHVGDFFREILGAQDSGRSEIAAELFVNHLVGRAWVLTEKAPGRFEFTHRSFLEYFFAKHLDEECETVGDLADLLLPHIKVREWIAPAHIAFQIKAERGIKNANRCAEIIYEKINASKPDDQPNLVLFGAEACEYLQPSDVVIKNISRLVVLCAKSEAYWSSAFISLLQVQTALRDAVYDGVVEGLLEMLHSYHGTNLAPTIDWLLALRLSATTHLTKQKMPWLDRAPDAVAKISQKLFDKIDFSKINLPFTFKAIFDLTGLISDRHHEYYDFRLWSNSTGGGRKDWSLSDLLTMRIELMRVIKNEKNLDQSPYARLAILIFENRGNTIFLLESNAFVILESEYYGFNEKIKLSVATNHKLGSVLKFVNRGIIQILSITEGVNSNAKDIFTPSQIENVFNFYSLKHRPTIERRRILDTYLQNET